MSPFRTQFYILYVVLKPTGLCLRATPPSDLNRRNNPLACQWYEQWLRQ